MVDLLAKHAGHLPDPARFLRRFYDPPPEESDEAKANAVLMECQICAMQFVLVRPVTSILSFLVFAMGNDQSQSTAAGYFLSFNFAIAMIENVSVFFAFSGLLKFYHAVAEDLVSGTCLCLDWVDFCWIESLTLLLVFILLAYFRVGCNHSISFWRSRVLCF